MDVADLDNDSDVDALLVYIYGGISWYENDGNANFKFNQSIDRNSGTGKLFTADLDGYQDVISPTASDGANYSSVRMAAWQANDGQGNFGPPQRIVDPASLAYASDLDRDGDQNIIFANQWYENDGTGSFGVGQIIIDPKEVFLGRGTADLNGDGDPDVLSFSYSDDKIVWYENRLGASPALGIIDLALIDTDTDQVVQLLLNGDTIDVATSGFKNAQTIHLIKQ